MENPSEEVKNSLEEEKKGGGELLATADVPVHKKKPFVFTEKRKENIIKANKVRHENNLRNQQLKERYEDALKELQTVYESKISNFKDNIPPMASSSSAPEAQGGFKPFKVEEIKVESVPTKSKKLKQERPSSDSESEEEVKEYRPPPKKGGERPRKEKEVDSLSESEEEVAPKRRKKETVIKKKTRYASDSDDSESERESRNSRQYRDHQPNMYTENRGRSGTFATLRPPQNPKIGYHSGCQF